MVEHVAPHWRTGPRAARMKHHSQEIPPSGVSPATTALWCVHPYSWDEEAANPNTYLRGKQEDQVRLWLGRCLVNCSMPLRGKGPVIFIPLPRAGDLPPSHTLCLLRAWVFLRREGRLHSASISEWQRILKGISQYLWFTYKNVSYILSQLLTNSMRLATKTENRNIWDCGYLIPICSEWTSKLPAFSKYESSTLIIACEWGKIIILPLVF